ncbi:MAG: hypothetical protein KAI57_00040 [Candidatus Pacebacteria bacterium]|nr:hypothetical protein [Candidatus Paceibacterota bacterium]
MFYSKDKSLFCKRSFDEYLRQVKSSIDQEIKNLSFQKIEEDEEEKIINTILDKFDVVIPFLLEDKIKIKAKEQEVVVGSRDSRFFHDGPFKRMGLSVTVNIPFEGLGDLFEYQPSTQSLSGAPSADIENNSLILYYETIEKEPEKIKNLWQKDINDIKQNLEWIKKDILNHSNSLGAEIKTLLVNRKKEARESQDLINKITI